MRLDPPAGSARVAAPRSEAPPAIAASPHTDAVLASVAGQSIVGLKDTAEFTRLSSLSVAERRGLLLDVSARAQEQRSDVLDALCYLLVDKTEIVEREADLVELLRAEQVLGLMARDALVPVLERYVERSGWSAALRAAAVASETLADRAARAPKRPPRDAREKLSCRAARLLREASGRPPFDADAWGASVLADLAAMSRPARERWSDLFAAWDDHPPPFAPLSAWRSDVDDQLAAIGREAVTSQARRWIAAFAASPPAGTRPGDDRTHRNLVLCDGLALLAAGPDPGVRLAYRALDLLGGAGDCDALQAIASASPYARVRRYAARPS